MYGLGLSCLCLLALSAEDHRIDGKGEERTRCDIGHRMLFQEYRGHADQDRQNQCRRADSAELPERLTLENADARHDGVVHMDAREHIGCRIYPVNHRDQGTAEILVRVDTGPEICAVRKQRADQQADRHAGEQIDTDPVKFLAVLQEQVPDGGEDIDEPQQVGDDKVLVERDQVIQPGVHDRQMGYLPVLQPEEPFHINKEISEDPDVSILMKQVFHHNPSFQNSCQFCPVRNPKCRKYPQSRPQAAFVSIPDICRTFTQS